MAYVRLYQSGLHCVDCVSHRWGCISSRFGELYSQQMRWSSDKYERPVDVYYYVRAVHVYCLSVVIAIYCVRVVNVTACTYGYVDQSMPSSNLERFTSSCDVRPFYRYACMRVLAALSSIEYGIEYKIEYGTLRLTSPPHAPPSLSSDFLLTDKSIQTPLQSSSVL